MECFFKGVTKYQINYSYITVANSLTKGLKWRWHKNNYGSDINPVDEKWKRKQPWNKIHGGTGNTLQCPYNPKVFNQNITIH